MLQSVSLDTRDGKVVRCLLILTKLLIGTEVLLGCVPDVLLLDDDDTDMLASWRSSRPRVGDDKGELLTTAVGFRVNGDCCC